MKALGLAMDLRAFFIYTAWLNIACIRVKIHAIRLRNKQG
jgi:hypothetical protein